MRKTMYGVYAIDVEKFIHEHDLVLIKAIKREMGKIAAVKVVILAFGCTLLQAKTFVETFCEENDDVS